MVMVRRIRILQGLQTGAASSAETNSGRLSVRIIGWPQVGLEEVGALSEWSAIRTEVKPRALSPSRASSRRSSRAHLSRRGNGLAICGQHSLRSRKAVNFVETCRSITQGPRTPPNHSLVSGAMVQITPQHIQFIFPGTVPRFGTASDANPVRIERCPTKRTLWTARSIRLRPKPLRVTRSSPPATPDRTSGGRTHRRSVPLINIEAKRDPTCRAQMLESLGYLPVSGYRSAPVQVCRRRCSRNTGNGDRAPTKSGKTTLANAPRRTDRCEVLPFNSGRSNRPDRSPKWICLQWSSTARLRSTSLTC